MSKTYTSDEFAVESFKSLLSGIPFKHHIKIHTIFNLNVPTTWNIESNRKNSDLHLLFVRGGCGSYYLDGRKELLTRGKIIFVSNNFPHSATPDKANLPSIIPIRFGIYDNTTFRMALIDEKPFCLSILPDDVIHFENEFERLYRYANELTDLERIKASTFILSQILFEIAQKFQAVKINANEERLLDVKHFIDNNPRHNISVSTLSKKVGVSEKHLTQTFKSAYGCTPKQYQIMSLIKYADFLLDDTSMSIKEIAIKLSYPDQYSFSKQYRKIKGMSPLQYRRKVY